MHRGILTTWQKLGKADFAMARNHIARLPREQRNRLRTCLPTLEHLHYGWWSSANQTGTQKAKYVVSQQTLASKIDRSSRTIRTHLKVLEAENLLEVETPEPLHIDGKVVWQRCTYRPGKKLLALIYTIVRSLEHQQSVAPDVSAGYTKVIEVTSRKFSSTRKSSPKKNICIYKTKEFRASDLSITKKKRISHNNGEDKSRSSSYSLASTTSQPMRDNVGPFVINNRLNTENKLLSTQSSETQPNDRNADGTYNIGTSKYTEENYRKYTTISSAILSDDSLTLVEKIYKIGRETKDIPTIQPLEVITAESLQEKSSSTLSLRGVIEQMEQWFREGKEVVPNASAQVPPPSVPSSDSAKSVVGGGQLE